MRLSDMTADEVVWAIQTAEHSDPRRMHAVGALSRLASIPRSVVHADARDLLDDWFERDGESQAVHMAAAAIEVTCQRVHRPTVEAAMLSGVPLVALALCSDACAGVASADLGEEPGDMRQVSVTPEAESYRVMVPLNMDVYHDGWRLLIRSGVLPSTIVAALPGHPATKAVEHPMLEGRLITAVADDAAGAFDTLELDTPRLETWSTIA